MEKREGKLRKILIAIFVVLALVLSATGGYLAAMVNSGSGSTTVDSGLQVLNEVKYFLLNEFYYGDDSTEYEEQLIEDAINGMVDAQGDPYTTYMNAEEVEEFYSQLSSSFVGIGVSYQMYEGNILVVSVVRFSPAEEAGIMAGDLIVAVDGVRCEDSDEDTIVNAIKGEEGTTVVITVLRNGEEIDFEITRATISSTVDSEMKDGIGVLTISSFSDGTGEEVIEHLAALVEEGATRLVIDIRNNTGGYLSTLITICDCFMQDGDIIMREVDRDGNETIDYASGENYTEFESIVILVNDYSASCSEVFALAMKENCGAVIVGETTYGKGVAQLTVSLSNGGAIKYTDCIWLSGEGVSVTGEGITPDYEVHLHDALNLSYLTLEDDESYGYDSVSDKVASMQLILDFLGYEVDRQDGYFDESTLEALEQFQRDMGIEVTGVLDGTTAGYLNTKMSYEWAINKDLYDTQMQKALEVAAG